MLVQCPHCGEMVTINGLGRKRLNIPLKNVCDALRLHRSVQTAANELRCSRAYIYKVLKTVGLTPTGVIEEQAAAISDQ